MNSTKRLEAAKKKLRDFQQDRQDLLRIFYDDHQLIAGSYAELLIRCGQPTCRCHKERSGHFATRLSRWMDGKLKSQIVKVADRSWVKEASNHYKVHKATLRNILKLNSKEVNSIKQLIKLKTINYQ